MMIGLTLLLSCSVKTQSQSSVVESSMIEQPTALHDTITQI